MNDINDAELEKLLARQEKRTKRMMKQAVFTFAIIILVILAFMLQNG